MTDTEVRRLYDCLNALGKEMRDGVASVQTELGKVKTSLAVCTSSKHACEERCRKCDDAIFGTGRHPIGIGAKTLVISAGLVVLLSAMLSYFLPRLFGGF